MKTQLSLISSGLVTCLVAGTAHAALQGRDLNGSAGSFEAYYDTVLDITWLADANHALTSGYDADGRMTWSAANVWASNLSFTDGIRTYDNWRLPTVKPIHAGVFNYAFSTNGSTDGGYNISAPGSVYEYSIGGEMAYMYYNTLGNQGYFTLAGSLSGCYVNSSNTCLDNVGPFSNLQAELYWTDLEFAPNRVSGWAFGMNDGNQLAGNSKVNTYYAWAVSSGDIAAPVPEPETHATFLAGLGLLAWRARRIGHGFIPERIAIQGAKTNTFVQSE